VQIGRIVVTRRGTGGFRQVKLTLTPRPIHKTLLLSNGQHQTRPHFVVPDSRNKVIETFYIRLSMYCMYEYMYSICV
jgi:hypothetical protein